MPIWTLEPLDLGNPNWEASTYNGKVIVEEGEEGVLGPASASLSAHPRGEHA